MKSKKISMVAVASLFLFTACSTKPAEPPSVAPTPSTQGSAPATPMPPPMSGTAQQLPSCVQGKDACVAELFGSWSEGGEAITFGKRRGPQGSEPDYTFRHDRKDKSTFGGYSIDGDSILYYEAGGQSRLCIAYRLERQGGATVLHLGDPVAQHTPDHCGQGKPLTRALKKTCSIQFRVPREDFSWGTTGSRGAITGDGKIVSGWALFDTGASYLRVRPDTSVGSLDVPAPAPFSLVFGDWRAQSDGKYSSDLLTFSGPSADGKSDVVGTQIGTIGSVLMKQWAVRFTPDAFFFSEDREACSTDQLSADGFHRMDSTGYYQRSGTPADVNPPPDVRAKGPLDLVIPTVQARILGHIIPVQIDTGYDAPDNDHQIQINKAMADLLKLPSSGVSTVKINGTVLQRHTPAGVSIEFIDSAGQKPFSKVSGVSLVVKDAKGGGIANWGIAAAMISGRVFKRAFGKTEFRADLASVWATSPGTP